MAEPITKRVYSSYIDSITYNPDAGILAVTYQSGKTSIHEVTPEQADSIWNAPSIGQALHATIDGYTQRGKRGKPG
jgi:KTSC domain